MESYPFNRQFGTPPFEFSRAVLFAYQRKSRKQRAGFWQGRQNFFNFLSEPDLWRLLPAPTGFHAHKTNDARLPIDVLSA